MGVETRIDILLHRARIGKFVSVGAIGAIVETIIVSMLTIFFGTGALFAKAVGAEVSISTMFAINDAWTFSDSGELGVLSASVRWAKSHLVRVVGLGISFFVLYLLTKETNYSLILFDTEFWPPVANVISIASGLSINYVAESLFTWDLADVS